VNVVWVYAFVSRSDRPSGAVGLEGERLRRVRAGGVDTIVGTLTRKPAAQTATLRRYDEIQRRLAARHPAVLPARFGTWVDDPADLAVLVRRQAVAIRAALRLVRDRVQMTTRLFANRDEVSVRSGARRPSPSASDRTDESTRGTRYLHARAEDARRRRELPEFAPLAVAVRRWIKAERMERQERGRLIGSVYHLIPRGAVSAYQQNLERAALDAGLTTIVSGPWPAYAFAPGFEE
jgi:hypothetical protein